MGKNSCSRIWITIAAFGLVRPGDIRSLSVRNLDQDHGQLWPIHTPEQRVGQKWVKEWIGCSPRSRRLLMAQQAIAVVLLVEPTHRDIIRFAPPLVITEEQLMECCRIIALSVKQFA